MDPPHQLVDWLNDKYRRPRVDLDWLRECYGYVVQENNLNPISDMQAIRDAVDCQVLGSSLKDSMVPNSGFPPNVLELDGAVIPGAPILVEILLMDEIGHSAFSLLSTAESRAEHVRQEAKRQAAAERNEPQDEDEEDGPLPTYPRSMLRFELTDGTMTLQAFEYSRLPEFELGDPAVGRKMLLKNVFVRRGCAYLKPDNVTVMIGSAPQDTEGELVRGWKARMGLPADNPVPQPAAPAAPPAQVADIPRVMARERSPSAPPPRMPGPAAASRGSRAPSHPPTPLPASRSRAVRSPLREISEPPEPGPSNTIHDDDEQQPRRRKIPARNRTPSPQPPPRSRSTHSRYFSDAGPSSSSSVDKGKQKAGDLARELIFSPHRNAPFVIGDTDDEFEAAASSEVGDLPPRKNKLTGGAADTVSVDYGDADIAEPGEGYASSDYGLEPDLTDFMMAELDRAEEEHRATQSQSQARNLSQAQLSLGSTLVGNSNSTSAGTQDTLVGGSRRGQSTGVGASQARSQRPPQAPIEYIEIEDDEEDEKENIAVPTRHTRRRVDPVEVIEISD